MVSVPDILISAAFFIGQLFHSVETPEYKIHISALSPSVSENSPSSNTVNRIISWTAASVSLGWASKVVEASHPHYLSSLCSFIICLADLYFYQHPKIYH